MEIADLPSIAHARLPAVYEQASAALEKCQAVDECQEWADKAEALASYAKQAGNYELRKMADRIQARAIRRCGELLREVKEGTPGPRSVSAPAQISRTQAAHDAGLSTRQKVTALRVASIPADEFEALVESDDPPTVTALAEQGTVHTLVDLGGRDPEDYKAATRALGMLHRFEEFAAANDPAAAARGASPREHKAMTSLIITAQDWLTRLSKEIADEAERSGR